MRWKGPTSFAIFSPGLATGASRSTLTAAGAATTFESLRSVAPRKNTTEPAIENRTKAARKVKIASPIGVSHFYGDDFADNQPADENHSGGPIEHLLARGRRPENAHSFRIDKIHA